MKKYNFPPELIFNFDETMLDASGRKFTVLTRSSDPKPFTENEAKLKHISIGLCISATGGFVKPLLILPLKRFPEVHPSVEKFFVFSGQQNGFIDNSIWHEWVKNFFIPHINNIRRQLNLPNQIALFIVDSHSTRKHEPTRLLFVSHNIYVLILPAHSSATLQPLDLSVNGELKRLLRVRFKPKADESGPTKRNRLLFTTAECMQGALLGMVIKDGFSRAGIFPFSKGAPLNSALVKHINDEIDFTPSNKKRKTTSIAGKCLTYELESVPSITHPTSNTPLLSTPTVQAMAALNSAALITPSPSNTSSLSWFVNL